MTKSFIFAVLLLLAAWQPVQGNSPTGSSAPRSSDKFGDPAPEGVILLHGLGRTGRSMKRMAAALEAEGFVVLTVDYPSRQGTIEELAEEAIGKALRASELAAVSKIHFVTHSMGGILLRQYIASTPVERLGKVVMLGPPNQGSEVVDALGHLWLFDVINGPAGKQLGTGPDSLPNRLGAVNFDLGVIAGSRSINWINSMMIAGPDDGKVSVARTMVPGMKAHLLVEATHPFLMKNREVIVATIRFLRNGTFSSWCEGGNIRESV